MLDKVNIALDMDELKEIMDNDMDLIQECFEDFLSDCPLLLEDIKNAIGQKDFQQIEESAHKLKGGLKYLAAGSAVNAAITIESAGKNYAPDTLEEDFLILENECRNLVTFIKGFTP
jgi:HPt (histidine-containing phosphotransfer) domain-containing protein